MKILFITHAEFEKLGYFETWAKKNNYEVEEVKPFKGETLPNVTMFDALIIMGGPQSPLEMEKAPYLFDEINIIKQAIEKDYPILGVCLGAQLIGEALNAKAERSPYREIGMYPIQLSEDAKDDPIFSKLPDTFNVMHWHNDMPGITTESKILAVSEGCPRQVIRYSEKIYGFQCHLELTKELVAGLIDNCPNDLKEGKYIHSTDQLMNVDYNSINEKLDLILSELFRR